MTGKVYLVTDDNHHNTGVTYTANETGGITATGSEGTVNINSVDVE